MQVQLQQSRVEEPIFAYIHPTAILLSSSTEWYDHPAGELTHITRSSNQVGPKYAPEPLSLPQQRPMLQVTPQTGLSMFNKTV